MNCRILLADDHQIVRQGLRSLLEKAGHSVVAEASDGREALGLARALRPQIAVLDLSMPLINGLELSLELREQCASVRSILLTMHADRRYVTHALRAGARGYVLKTQAAEDLLGAIPVVCRGQVYLSPGLAGALAPDPVDERSGAHSDPLSPRERQVLQLVSEGRTSKHIARQLNISPKTAESHRYNIMRKLGLHDVASLVRYAIGRGMLHAQGGPAES